MKKLSVLCLLSILLQMGFPIFANASSLPSISTAVLQNQTETSIDLYITGGSFNAFVHSTTATADSTDLLGITFNSQNPTAATIVEDGTIKHLTATFDISIGTSATSDLTIAANTIKGGGGNNNLLTILQAAITDTTAPVVTEGSAVASPTSDSTPDYTFNSTEAGSIAYGGGCTASGFPTAVAGPNVITFDALADGTYDCTIQVTDSSTNASIVLNVSEFVIEGGGGEGGDGGDGTPSVTDVTSSNDDGTYGVGDDIFIQVVFSEAVQVDSDGTEPYLDLNSGGMADYDSGSGSDTLTFLYHIAPGESTPVLEYVDTTSLNLNEAAIRDSATDTVDADVTLTTPGEAGSLSDDKNINIPLDITGPYVQSFTWEDNDVSGSINSADQVRVTFSEAIDQSTLDLSNLDLRLGLSNDHTFGTDGNGLSIAWNDGNELTITLASNTSLALGDTIDPSDSVTDLVGNPDGTVSPVQLTAYGYFAEFWNLAGDSDVSPAFPEGVPDFITTTQTIDYAWGGGSPFLGINDDDFAARFTKTAFLSGTYSFLIGSDDGGRVYLDDSLIIDCWSDAGCGRNDTIAIEPGVHTIAVEYYENNGAAGISFSYTSPVSDVYVDDDYTSDGENDGHTWGVDAFDSIQDGIDATEEAGNVHVAAGTYNETISIDKELTLTGDQDNGGDPGAGPEAPEIDGTDCPVVSIDANNVVFQGFVVVGTPDCDAATIRVSHDVSNATISHNDISGNYNGVALASASNTNTVSYNLIHDETNSGVAISGSYSNTVDYNEIKDNGYTGILLRMGGCDDTDCDPDANDNIIDHNVIHNNGDAGIRSELGNNNQITNNIVYANSFSPGCCGGQMAAIVLTDQTAESTAYNNLIRGNTVYGNDRNGIGIWANIPSSEDANTIENNIVYGNAIDTEGDSGVGPGGIVVRADYTIVTNNKVSDDHTGLIIGGGDFSASSVVVSHNTIGAATISGSSDNDENCTDDDCPGNDAYGVYVFNGLSLDIHNNNIAGNDYGVFNRSGETVDATNNWWGDTSGPLNDPDNLEGLGDEVSSETEGSNAVLFDPWRNAPIGDIYVDDDYTSEGDNDLHQWNVDAFSTVQEGIDAAIEGDTVHVASGTYNQDEITVDTSGITIEGPGIEALDPAIVKNTNCSYVFGISANDVTLAGLHLEERNEDGEYCQGSPAVRVLGERNSNSNTQISGVTISYNDIGGGNRGIILRGDSRDSHVTHNNIHDNEDGIFVASSDDNIIDHNSIYDNQTGVNFYWGDCGTYCDGHADNNTVSFNDIYHNGFLDEFDDTAGILFYVQGQDNVFSSNSIHDNSKHGIAFHDWWGGGEEGHPNIITENEIYDNGLTVGTRRHNGPSGIEIIGDYTEITHNLIYQNRRNGIQLGGDGCAYHTTITDNTIGKGYAELSGLNGNTERGIFIRCADDNTEIHNNIIQDNPIGLLNQDPETDIDASNNYWGSSNGPTHFTNPDGEGDQIGDGDPFDQDLDQTYASDPTETSAILHAALNTPTTFVSYRPFYTDPQRDTLNEDEMGDTSYTERGFEYGTSTLYGSTVSELNEEGFGANSYTLETEGGIVCGTKYHFRPFVVTSYGTTYGPDSTFYSGNCDIQIVSPVSDGTTTMASPLMVLTNASAVCSYDIDESSGAEMEFTGGTIHTQSLRNLSTGEHTVSVSCDTGEDILADSVTWIKFSSAGTALYAADGPGDGGNPAGSSSLIKLDPETGNQIDSVEISGGLWVSGLAFDTENNILYASTGNQGNHERSLFTISGTGHATLLGTIEDSYGEELNMNDLAYNNEGVLYGFSNQENSLYTIDPDSCDDDICTAVLIDNTDDDGNGNGLAINSNDEYYWFHNTESFDQISPTTGLPIRRVDIQNPQSEGWAIPGATFDSQNMLFVARLFSDLSVLDTDRGIAAPLSVDNPDMAFIDALTFGPSSFGNFNDVEEPVGLWHLNENSGTVAADSSLSGNDGVVNGDPHWVTGKEGHAFQFNGEDNYITINRPVSKDFTICAWIKTDTAGTGVDHWETAPIMDSEVEGVATGDFGFGIDANGKLAYGNGDGDVDITINGNTKVTDNKWHLACVTREKQSGTATLYVDEKVDATGDTHSTILNSNSEARIGYGFDGTPQHFKGLMDEIRAYRRVLTLNEIKQIYGRIVESGGAGGGGGITSSALAANLSLPSAQDCKPGYSFSPTTGARCGSPIPPPSDCRSGYSFSPSTGRSCAGTPNTPSIPQNTLPPTSCPVTLKLEKGHIGEQVKCLQILLGGIKVDGIFGQETLDAVLKFQKNHSLIKVDGVVGPETRAILNAN